MHGFYVIQEVIDQEGQQLYLKMVVTVDSIAFDHLPTYQ
jgi:hypothetical protein